MNNKLMLFECLECKETYLADNMCDGYSCPKCNGHVMPGGYIHEIEEQVIKVQDKISRAKMNGLIRKYNKPPKPKLPPIPNDYISGVDLSGKKDFTININVDIEDTNKDKLIEEMIKKLYDPKEPRRSGTIV